MTFIRMIRPPNVTAEIYDKVNAEAGVADDPPPGLLLHCAGDADGNWQIVDVWESEEHARRFDEQRLGPAIERVIGGPPQEAPRTQSYELYRVIMP